MKRPRNIAIPIVFFLFGVMILFSPDGYVPRAGVELGGYKYFFSTVFFAIAGYAYFSQRR